MFLSIGEGPHRDPLAMGLQRAAEGLVRNTGQAAVVFHNISVKQREDLSH